ncbi:MAG: type III secretion system cytoplasmic ring protein SctQ [Pseudomonadota bacterium]|nr:type III secretion system cytoplasmic ring protein SctQ [Pseudomonadota bacterium]
MMVEKFELSRTAPEQVRFANLLLKQPLRLVSEQVTCHQLHQISKPQGELVKIECAVGQQLFSLFATHTALQTWLERQGYALSIASLPSALLEALIEKLLSPLQGSFKQLFGEFVAIASISLSSPYKADEESFCCEFTLSTPDDLALIIALKQHQLARLISQNPISVRQDLLAIDLKLSVSMGKTILPQTDYLALACGDVVFFDQCYFDKEQRVCLSIENTPAWQAQLNNHTITIEHSWSNTMSEEQLAQPNAVFDLNTVQVELDFSLPSQTLSLPDVQNLQPGYVFESDCNPDSPILIKVNNQVIANGELVKVGEKLGVRILDVAGN